MKLLSVAIAFALLLQVAWAEEGKGGWSWGESEDKPKEEKIEDQQAVPAEKIKRTLSVNATDDDGVIDNILVSNRQGRNLDGYDELYNDPTVREVLQNGDDNEARNVIRERLCNLGLMQCDDDGKYLSPEDLIYAQPVAINPVGKPIASIPIRNPHRIGGYGPPKPMPPPGKYGPPNGPPRRGYGPPGPQKPYYSNQGPKPYPPFLSGPPPSHSSYPPSRPPNGPNFEGPDKYAQPLEPVIPYEFENIGQSSFNKKQVIVPGPTGASANGVQQHVHHHFHHGAASSEIPTLVVGNTPAASNLLGGSLSAHNGGFKESSFASGGFKESTFGSGGFKESSLLIGDSGFKDLNTGTYGGQTLATYGGNTGLGNFASAQTAVKPVHENQGPQTFNAGSANGGLYSGSNGGLYSGSNGFGASNYGGSNNYASGTYASGNFGTSVGSYGSTQPFYKKELNIAGGNLNGNSLQQGYVDKYQGVESGRAENYDCVCVPFNQCPTQDIIGRKEDLYLAIDPRNKNSDIEAVTDDIRVITDGNGTMSVVRVPKDATINNVTDTAEEKKDETATEVKKVSKRDAPEAKALGDSAENDSSEGRLGGFENVKPTFGVSFGLPNQGGGGYPINPHGPNPFVNPYGGSVGSPGINLGLISVNPLVSLQFTKDKYGGKVLHPFVNLHVTPNDYLVHKVGDFLAHKKGYLHNKYHHYHHYKKPHFYKPHYHHGPPPQYYSGPPSGSEFYPGPGGPGGPGGPFVDHPPPGAEIYPGSGGPGSGPGFGPGGPGFGPGGPGIGPGGPGFGSGSGPGLSYYDDPSNYGFGGGGLDDGFFGRAAPNMTFPGSPLLQQYQQRYENSQNSYGTYGQNQNTQPLQNDPYSSRDGRNVAFPTSRRRRNATESEPIKSVTREERQAFYGNGGRPSQTCGPRHVCCKRPYRPQVPGGFPGGVNPGFAAGGVNPSFAAGGVKPGFGAGGVNQGFGQGVNQGFNQGAGQGFTQGAGQGFNQGINQGFTQGAGQGFNQGINQGFNQGVSQGFTQGANQGFGSNLNQQNPAFAHNNRQCGSRHSQGINGRIKNPVYIDGDSEFGEYPWQVAILKKDPKESVYVCGGTLIDNLHIITAAHCVKTYTGFDLRVRLGEWDVNHDVEFYPYVERDIVSVHVHPEFYAGTLYNDLAILRMDKPVDWTKSPHISPACLPGAHEDFTGTRCWTTGWGKDAFGDFGKYQNILKEVDVPVVGHAQCQQQLQQTRLGYDFKLHPGFVCAGGEEGKDACKGDGGGPMVCERGGTWSVVGVVSWGIGCGQYGVPGVYVRVAHYLDWIRQITQRF